ncbi:polysaccharide deacetylase family protein [Natronococcus jeotgali]|uniref:Polysaccharide deacetylase n=1 Tax=Natronococcus jeotgali DSM 18795 TaxID=1227498 RepID=L9XB52_9EURY|nr:polysaccharide deacetylase [Natronococcus jeotgali]ELY57848.1 polysaccharide deacetylase [Natronococcus jeotgali DSM 18795]
MDNGNNAGYGSSRRRLLAAVGASSATLAGCTDFLSEEESGDSGNGNDSDGGNGGDSGNGNDSDDGGNSGGETLWPAIDDGELLADFEEEPTRRTGELSMSADEARRGSQAAVVEDESGESAGLTVYFSDGIDLTDGDVSFAAKPEGANRIVVEFIAPGRQSRLTTVRLLPDEYTGWLRLDCGYEHKPAGEPDLSNVTAINILATNDGRPIKLVVDDLRKTDSVDNGKAILLLQGGYDSQYEIAADMLEERGWAAAVPVNPEAIGAEGRMDVTQLQELRDRGWDVCPNPGVTMPLSDMPKDRQRTVLENAKATLEERGFENGARHLLVPDDRMDQTTHEVVRDVYDTAYLFGSCPNIMPPTAQHMLSHVWGPSLHSGVRRHVNLADQYNQLTVLRMQEIVDTDEPEGDEMTLDEFEHLLNHLENRGLDVITPSDLVDGSYGGEGADGGTDGSAERPEGTIFEAGQSHGLDGNGSGSETVELDEGLVVAEFSHEGNGDFVVELDGDVLTAASGSTTGESVATVGGGTAEFAVEADGSWSIEITQPAVHADDLEELPVERSGSGSGYVGPLWTEGGVSLSPTHDGDGTFIVDGYGADGSREQIVNKTGSFDNSRSYAAGGTVWINVEADGDWTLGADPS